MYICLYPLLFGGVWGEIIYIYISTEYIGTCIGKGVDDR